MPRAGTISVLIDSPLAAAAAHWLKRRVPPEPTLLGRSPEDRKRCEWLLANFRAKLEKAGRRKNSKRYLLVDRETAHEFVLASTPMWPTWGIYQPHAVRQLNKALRDKLDRKKRVGRPKLDLDDMQERIKSSYAYDERNRRRLKPRLVDVERARRQSEAFDRWFSEVHRRGETILTTTLPFPETP